ncbi:MAG: hypothetical protein RLZZ450_2508 [Pseudomonadota bacterium]|jgi:hypothetical protein
MVEKESTANRAPWDQRTLPIAIFAVLFAVLSWTYWHQSWPATTHQTNGIAVASKTLHLDGTYYYAYLRSLILDQDLDFTNDYQLLGNPLGATTVELTKRPGNLFTIGPALFWTPFFLVGHLLSALAGWGPTNGAGERVQMFVFYGSCVYGLAACILSYLTASLAFRRTDAFLAALAAMFATPLYWHMMRQASYSHAISAFCSALVVFVWARNYGSLRPLRWWALGLLCGLGMSVRTAAVAHAIVPAAELLPGLVASLLQRDLAAARQRALSGVAFALGLLLGFLPQMLAWKAIYGAYLTIPQGSGFMIWSGSRYGAVLFSNWNGWAAWHPLVSVGLLGLAMASIRANLPPALRTLARAALLVIGTQAFLNGAAGDWYAGFAFGGRRFTDCTVYVAVGVAQIFSLLGDRDLTVFLSRTLRTAIPALIAAAFAYFSLFLGERHLLLEIPIWGPVDLAGTWKAAVTSGMDKVYALTGNWGSIPVNWWFASSGNVSPARYDTADARAEFPTIASVWAFTDTGVGLGGFGDVATYQGRQCRWLSGRDGRFAFLLRTPEDLHARVALAAVMPGLQIRLSLEGQTLLETEPDAALKTFEFDIPGSV